MVGDLSQLLLDAALYGYAGGIVVGLLALMIGRG